MLAAHDNGGVGGSKQFRAVHLHGLKKTCLKSMANNVVKIFFGYGKHARF